MKKYNDPPSKNTHKQIMETINLFASQGKSYDDIIKGIDDLLQLKDIQQETESMYPNTESRIPKEEQSYVDPKYTGQYAFGGILMDVVLGMGQDYINKEIQQNKQAGAVKNYVNQIQQSMNPYSFKNGGNLKGSIDNSQYVGNSHAQGGINVNVKGLPSANSKLEVEGKETATKIGESTYIFSDKLTI